MAVQVLIEPAGLIAVKAGTLDEKTMLWQTLIHVVFLVSAVAIAAIDRIMTGPPKPKGGH